MANLQDLNRRISSVGNMRKITRAMEMVAAAKLRRAQDRIQTLRPFAQALVELTARVGSGSHVVHPLLAEREPRKVCLVMYTGDRGLAGAVNANILRHALEFRAEWQTRGAEVSFITVGRKGAAALKFRGIDIDASFTNIIESPAYHDAETIASHVIAQFSNETFDHVVMVYNHFDSAISQSVKTQQLLPLTDAALVGALDAPREGEGHDADWEYEPSEEGLLDRLLPTYVEQSCYRALLESSASFYGAQMTAMRNASDNAGELFDDLTLIRNRARQAAITQEILEIVGGASAL